MNSTTIQIMKTDEAAFIPTRGSDGAAGWDLYADYFEDEEGNKRAAALVKPGQSVKIGTGIAMQIPENCFGAIYARSGLACKRGLRPKNCVAVIDSDYTGEIIVYLHNDSDKPQILERGDRIAQMVIQEYVGYPFEVVDHLTDTARGSGGFGSTGK